jgi:hypothetical protein
LDVRALRRPPAHPLRPVLLVRRKAMAGAALVAVELAVGELRARQEVLDDLQRRHEGPVAAGHGAAIALLGLVPDRELLEELAKEQEDHTRRSAVFGDLVLVRAWRNIGDAHGGLLVAGVRAMVVSGAAGRDECPPDIVHR